MMQDMVQTAKRNVEVSPTYLADPSRDHFLISTFHGVPNVHESHSADSDKDSEQGNHHHKMEFLIYFIFHCRQICSKIQ